MGTVELPVVVGVDGSDAASDALDWAAELAGRRGLPLRVVHASLWERYEGYVAGTAADRPAERLHSEAVLATAAERAGRRVPALKVMTDLAADDAVTALLRAGQSAEALVVGSRGRGEFASLLLGSVGLGIAARAQCPVVVVRGRPENVHGGSTGWWWASPSASARASGSPRRPRPPSRSPSARGAAARRRAGGGARMALCGPRGPRSAREPQSTRGPHGTREPRSARGPHGTREPQSTPGPQGTREPQSTPGPHGTREATGAREDHARRAAELLDETLGGATAAGLPPVPVAHRPVEGSARKALLDASAHADLLVVGARRRQGHFGMQLGLVNHAVLHHAKCPVAVVPVS
ncbi:Universal stress protein OS=Streptomyces antimycoticus OX=68175 GN=SANT12839_015130 PE=3 SV=1 [Streptomyces antimycoticus]